MTLGTDTIDSGRSAALARVARGDLCAGCGGCAALAPGAVQMDVSPEGYLRPVQCAPLTAAEDAHITQICPGLTQRVDAQGRRDDPLWGPYLKMHQGYATNPDLRHAGASGGSISALAAWLLDTGQVDAVLQITADPQRAVGNIATLSRTAQDVHAAAGSRYAPAAPLAVLQDLPDDVHRLAFVGKPCDAAALRAMMALDPALARRVTVVLSFFCAGTPSLVGADAVLAALDTPPSQAAAFRYRGNGWPGFATVQRQDGSTAQMSYHDSWGKILSKHVQHRCKICADGTGVAADIVCADAWDSDEDGYPVFEEADGTSLIVSRTELGARLLDQAEADGALVLSDFDDTALAAIQPGQRNRRRALLARLLALRLVGRPVPKYTGLGLLRAARGASVRFMLRNFLGTVRRALRP
ncbi:MAG: Coenzyme F420 hydrogenase/dehydrogenase, beta subunit C-terminal domain [Pseudomonadota bacterium]